MTFAVLNYEYRKYMKSNKYIVPLIALFSYLAASYSIGPLSVLSSYSLSSLCLFLIMVWIGFSYNEVKENVIEQVIYLKAKNKYSIWTSRIILVFSIGFILSVVAIVFPLITNAINDNFLFNRPVLAEDVIIAFIVHIVFSCTGSILGLFFNEHNFKNRKLAVTYIIFIALITVIRGALEHNIPLSKLVTWILPPIYHFAEIFGKMEFVNVNKLLVPFVQLLIYIGIEVLIYIKLMKYRLYG